MIDVCTKYTTDVVDELQPTDEVLIDALQSNSCSLRSINKRPTLNGSRPIEFKLYFVHHRKSYSEDSEKVQSLRLLSINSLVLT